MPLNINFPIPESREAALQILHDIQDKICNATGVDKKDVPIHEANLGISFRDDNNALYSFKYAQINGSWTIIAITDAEFDEEHVR